MTTPFQACIADAHAKGDLDADTAAQVRGAYDSAYEAAADLGPVEADRLAAGAAMTALERQALRAKVHRALSVRTRVAALNEAKAFLEARGYTNVSFDSGKGGGRPPKGGWTLSGEPPKEGPYAKGGILADWLKELVDGSGGLAGAAGPSVKGRYQALAGSFQAMMADLSEAFDTVTGLPTKGRALLDNLVREAFGEDTGDQAAKALSKAWGDTAEYSRQLFNAAGGEIGKLEKWGLPQSHNALALRTAGKDAWLAAITPRLDAGRMIDRLTDKPFAPAQLKAVLSDVYDSIVTLGAIDREMGEALGKGKVADQRAEHRFLVFKDADNWMAYQAEFGVADPYAAMMRHLDGMALDIARLQVLGPNPDHQFDWLARAALRMGDIEGAGVKARANVESARQMYGHLTGELGGAYGPDVALARVGKMTRSALAGIQLGGAVINDLLSNPVFAAKAKALAGLSAMPDFRAYFAQVTSPQARAAARRTGFIAENARARNAEAIQRYLRSQTVGGKAWEGANALGALLPHWVNTAGLLDGNMKASRRAFQDEFMGYVADRRGQTLAQLAASKDSEERAFSALLSARGWTENDWDVVRTVAPERYGEGIEFVSPQALAKAGREDIGWKLAETIERETRAVVPEPSLWSRAKMMGTTRPGTLRGEFQRSLMTYRSFSVTQTYSWGREFIFRAAQAGNDPRVPWKLRVAAQAAPLVLGATLAGALTVWTKDMIKGRDPRPAWSEDPEQQGKVAYQFWGAALAQGGGQGILGDFFFSAQARNGKSSALTAFGPAAGLVSDTFDLTWGNADEAIKGKETHAGREAVRFAGRYNPLASLWWSRAIMDRAVIDQIQRLIDPEADEQFRRQSKRLADEYGQGEWWPEGQAVPERAPNLGNAAQPVEP
ncbi:hypothetical protein [Caulobacter hibisci]|uniref:Uncharacterized protein n=1 Tax=Caulobacter hibisci TaxID=2035993 RepID=A0ABS0SYX7_9CAUL|nr:hypothetical protein [Caulobacter hibisci]MBI1684466.1 hypothetical protein [Caulobacter hibisci]